MHTNSVLSRHFADLVHTLSRVSLQCSSATGGGHLPFLRGLRSRGGSAMAAGSYAYLGEAEVVGAGAALLGEAAGPPPAAALPGEAGGASALLGDEVVAAAALEGEAAAAARAKQRRRQLPPSRAKWRRRLGPWGRRCCGSRQQRRPHHLGDRIHRASLDGLLVAACGRC
jgi:hypothetical protein